MKSICLYCVSVSYFFFFASAPVFSQTAEAPVASCGACTSHFGKECEAECALPTNQEEPTRCRKKCLKSNCSLECACRDCKKAAAKSCKSHCTAEEGAAKDKTCLSKCLRSGCVQECGEPVPRAQRPVAQW